MADCIFVIIVIILCDNVIFQGKKQAHTAQTKQDVLYQSMRDKERKKKKRKRDTQVTKLLSSYNGVSWIMMINVGRPSWDCVFFHI